MREILPPQTDSHEDTDELTLLRAARATEIPMRIAQLSTKLSALALGGLLIFQTDIVTNKLMLENESPQVHLIMSSDDEYNDTQTTLIDGFASQDGRWAARSLKDPIEALLGGDITALEHDSNGISPKAVAKEIAKSTFARGDTKVNLYGHSLGGIEALKVAIILRNTYGITVETIVLDRTPSSEDTIEPSKKGQADLLLGAIDSFMIDGTDIGIDLQYSRIARGVFDLILGESASHMKRTAAPFIVDQLTMASTANTMRDIQKLADNTSLPLPTIVYVTSPQPDSDGFVMLDQALDDFQQSANKAGLSFIVLVVDSTHSRPDLAQSAYLEEYASAAQLLSLKRDEMNDDFLFASGATIHTYIKTW